MKMKQKKHDAHFKSTLDYTVAYSAGYIYILKALKTYLASYWEVQGATVQEYTKLGQFLLFDVRSLCVMFSLFFK